MPIATEILPGNKADDPLYIPAIEQVRLTLKKSGLLYIGDCKMASIGTRSHIALGKDDFEILEPDVTEQIKLLGWRVYVTNHTSNLLPLKTCCSLL